MNRTPKLPTLLALLLGLSFLATAQADRLDEILDRGSLRIGVSLFTPWTMKDKSGELIGHEIDVARKLAADMGVKPELSVYPWADIVGALNAGEIDLILAGMAITPQRALQVNFTRPYVESGVLLATNSHMTRDISDMRELNRPEIVVVAVAKTLGSDVAKLLFDDSDLRILASSGEARQAVVDGKAHAYVASSIEATFLALEHPDTVDLPISKPLLTSVAGIGVRKGEQELLNFLNAWIASRTADGWLPATSKYWFKSLKWREVVPQ
jgi:polar amino acid transport system substrate-binding protein